MKGIGGNIKGYLQISTTIKNEIGEQEKMWLDSQTLKGWLDLSSGDSKYLNYSAKVPETTHIFICDYIRIDDSLTPENSRMIINGKAYDVLLIDNPMEMETGSQLEIFLKYTGGQNGI